MIVRAEKTNLETTGENTMKFKDLTIGATFYFPPHESWQSPNGPYVKMTARKYRDNPIRFSIPFVKRDGKPGKQSALVYEVGTINVSVTTVS